MEQAQGQPLGVGMAVGVEGCFDIGRYLALDLTLMPSPSFHTPLRLRHPSPSPSTAAENSKNRNAAGILGAFTSSGLWVECPLPPFLPSPCLVEHHPLLGQHHPGHVRKHIAIRPPAGRASTHTQGMRGSGGKRG